MTSRRFERFGDQCDVVTYEFENVPVAPLASTGRQACSLARVSLGMAQDRAVEKRFLEQCGVRVAPWREVDSADDIVAALDALGAADPAQDPAPWL